MRTPSSRAEATQSRTAQRISCNAPLSSSSCAKTTRAAPPAPWTDPRRDSPEPEQPQLCETHLRPSVQSSAHARSCTRPPRYDGALVLMRPAPEDQRPSRFPPWCGRRRDGSPAPAERIGKLLRASLNCLTGHVPHHAIARVQLRQKLFVGRLHRRASGECNVAQGPHLHAWPCGYGRG